MTDAERKKLAAYIGAVGRWAALTGNVGDATDGRDKAAQEFAAFNRHLDQLDAEKRRIEEITF
ncbi:MAG: hypothetical protein J5I99_05885 [Verrucomicrobia bacterium]|nr:hypothetical protein [Verrucomicrobiota bacterium]